MEPDSEIQNLSDDLESKLKIDKEKEENKNHLHHCACMSFVKSIWMKEMPHHGHSSSDLKELRQESTYFLL